MKIIAHTACGYIAELSPPEIAAITGNSSNNDHAAYSGYGRHGHASHAIGTEFKVCDTWKHLGNLLSNEESRKRIAESLRAAATLIEHTPSPIVLPPTEEQPSPGAI
jgi:hypothetical protein